VDTPIQISSAPLQGMTDAIFRSVHHQIWGGVDAYYGPYLRLDSHKEPKANQIRDIISPLNKKINYIPQLMGNHPALLLERITWLHQLGYEQVNWNLGCPYPMVTKRNMGAGLLNQPQLVEEILQEIIHSSPLPISIKCRLGYMDDQEIFPLIDVFNKFNIKEIIIHARTASQLYKGSAQPEKVLPIQENSKHTVTYNGDIDSMEKFQEIQQIFQGKINHYMLGRGLLRKPFLAQQIGGIDHENIKEQMQLFHDTLTEQYAHKLQDHQLLMKMRSFWEYFSHSFSNPHKAYKMIKKASNMKKYGAAVAFNFSNFSNFDS